MIIGVVGFIGSGKGTVADYLIEKYRFKKVSFADPLKDSVAAVFGWDRALLEGDTKESREFREQVDPWWTERFGYDVTPRLILQKMGTEAGRDVFHENLWVHAAAKRMDDPRYNFVVPDVRFKNEVKFVQELGGKVIRVKRGPEPEWYNLALAANNPSFTHSPEAAQELSKKLGVHQSEWDWVGSVFDYVINNDGTMLDFHERIENVYGDVMTWRHEYNEAV